MTTVSNNYANSYPTKTSSGSSDKSSSSDSTDKSSSSSSTDKSSSSSSTATAQANLNQNYTSFLKMLTTQLQNQDPTKPMDANEMTSQLVQYSMVEQNIATNSRLDKLLSLQQQSTASTNLAYLGRTVIYKGDEFNYSPDGQTPSLSYNLETSAKKVDVKILDADNKTVRTLTGETSAGTDHVVTWDGKDDAGNQMPAGTYSISVVPTGKTTDEYIKRTTYTYGTVSGVQYSKDGEMQVVANGLAIPVSDLKSVH